MDTLEAIWTRRSVRRYLERPVPEDLLETVLKAGMYAPSAGNEQPWHFIVIDSKKLFGRIMAAHPYASMMETAPVAIMVCGDTRMEIYPGNWMLDCAAATQNMLLAAHAEGLGAVWLGVFPDAERMAAMRGIFDLPADIQAFSIIALGYTEVPREDAHRFRPERVHHNGWKTGRAY